MSYDTTASTYRRRGGRYSSMCMSSAESNPLFTTPTSGHGQVPAVPFRLGSTYSAVSPSTCAGIMLETDERGGLAHWADQSSEKRPAPSTMPKSPEVAAFSPRNASSAAASRRRSFSHSENMYNPMFLDYGVSTSTSNLPGLSMKSPSQGSLTGALRHLRRSQRRTASSRQSEICTPEGIPEASDEDLSGSNSTSGVVPAMECIISDPNACDNGSLSSGMSSVPIVPSEDKSFVSGNITDPVDQAFERARMTQEQPPKVLQSPSTARRFKNSGLRVEFANPLHGSPSCPVSLTEPTNAINLSGASTPLARAVMSESITPENTRGIWCPPRPRTPAAKRDLAWADYFGQDHGNVA